MFAGEAKSAKFCVVFNITRIWAARVWKCSKISEVWNKVVSQRWSLCVLCKFAAVRSRTPEIYLGVWARSKIWQQKCAKSYIILPRIVRFCSKLTQSFITWCSKDHKSSRSRRQRSRSQRDVTRAKICQLVNNSAGGCSISIKFTTDYDHMPTALPQTFKVSGSKARVIAWHEVLAWKNRYISWRDSLTEFKVCANYPIT